MEELKVIMEAVAQLGEAGKEAFIWWLIIDKALHTLAVVTIFVTISVCFYKAVRHVNNSDSIVSAMCIEAGIPGHCNATEKQRLLTVAIRKSKQISQEK